MRQSILILSAILLTLPAPALAQEEAGPLSLEQSIQLALGQSPSIAAARDKLTGANYKRKAALADFFPKVKGEYSYLYLDQAPSFDMGGDGDDDLSSITLKRIDDPKFPEGLYNFLVGEDGMEVPIDMSAIYGDGLSAGGAEQQTFTGTLEQPLFTGLALINQYKIAKLEVEATNAEVDLAVENMVLLVHEAYFNVLKAGRFLDVAEQAVGLLEALVRVAQDFLDVGMIPKNDLLKAEVELANIRQGRVKAANAVALAEAVFNIALRRDIDAPVSLVDILEHKPFGRTQQECFDDANANRLELKMLDTRIDQAERAVSLARSPFYPTVGIFGSFRWEDGGFIPDPEVWSAGAVAKWTLWDWGKTYSNVQAARATMNRARNEEIRLRDGIKLEVKRAYLSLREAEANISVAEKSIEQAGENYRITEEQYKASMTTSTEVLDAQTQLSQARLNYYSALSDYNIELARLRKATGKLFTSLAGPGRSPD